MGNNQDNKLLFGQEEKIVRLCKAEMESGEFEGNPLLPKYQKLVRNYERLLKFTKKIVKIADTQGNVLKKREYKIKSLLDNSSQGFLTFGADLLVDEEYSAECTSIFGQKIRKEHISSLLSNDPGAQQKYIDVFKSIFKELNEGSLAHLPSNINIHNRHIDVKYKLINRMDDEYAILVILTDVTEKTITEAQIKYLSEHDCLTCLYNRSYIDKIIPQIIAPSKLPLSVVLADMNALKLTNDVFGHQKGDQLIVKVAQILKKCCRETDIVSRWGGDEFLLLLPNTDSYACLQIVESINKACLETEQEIVDISVSMGTATMETPNANITELFAVAENRMYKNKLLDNKTVRKNIISKIETVLESNGIIPSDHIRRMKSIVVKFAGVLGFPEESMETQNLILLASLHDAGKIAIPQDLLKKQGQLTSDEWEIIKSYSEIGYRMAQSIGEPGVAEAMLALRERWDGTGYPTGLKGEQIPYLSRVFSILEVYDVITSDRAFQSALSPREARDEIQKQSGSQFDPTLTQIFLENLEHVLAPEKKDKASVV
ncbi:MAG: diguanylate cyclase [Firmicutes bacterium]|nr:diguanylate cyclase [Bacillota bacterium]